MKNKLEACSIEVFGHDELKDEDVAVIVSHKALKRIEQNKPKTMFEDLLMKMSTFIEVINDEEKR